MKRLFLTCLLAGATAIPAMAAEAVNVSLSVKEFVTRQCIAEQECTGFIKGNVSFSATIDLTPEEEAGLVEETSLTVVLSEVVQAEIRLGDDPNFSNGDTSAKFKTQVDVLGEIPAEANIQLKWGNGQLKIKLSLPFSGDDIVAKSAKSESKEPNGLKISIIAVNGITPVFIVDTFVTGDTKETAFQLESAEGNETLKASLSFKSRAIPLP